MIGGTNSCANADGRAVTTDARRRLHQEAAGRRAAQALPLRGARGDRDRRGRRRRRGVQGRRAPGRTRCPRSAPAARLACSPTPGSTARSGLLTWFGAPPQRELVFTVGNLGSAPRPGPGLPGRHLARRLRPAVGGAAVAGHRSSRARRREIKLPVELPAGAHGDYPVSLKYGGKVLAEQPWGVGRPWGVTLFWILLCVVVPAAVFRIGMAVVDRVRPRRAAGRRHAADVRTRPHAPAPPAEPPRAAGTGPLRHRPRPWHPGRPRYAGRLRRAAVVHPGHRTVRPPHPTRTTDVERNSVRSATEESCGGRGGRADARRVRASCSARPRTAQAAEVSYETECLPPPISGLPPVQGTTKVEISAPGDGEGRRRGRGGLEDRRRPPPRTPTSSTWRRTPSSRPARSRWPARRPATWRWRGRARTRRSPRTAR